VSELLAAVRTRLPGTEVRPAFLDHWAPSLPEALAALAPPAPGGPIPAGSPGRLACVALPLLLTPAYHSKADIPARLADAGAALPWLDVACADTLGPHPLLMSALERRLREAGVAVDDPAARGKTSVVLAAAGSSDPTANATIAALAAHWADAGGWRAVVPAYASAAVPRPDEAVAALRGTHCGPVVVASYLLAPGYFADKVRGAALIAGASAVSAALGAAPEVAAVVAERYLRALADRDGRRPSAVLAG
jgi:sirohydrochlorin ferrochelatase